MASAYGADAALSDVRVMGRARPSTAGPKPRQPRKGRGPEKPPQKPPIPSDEPEADDMEERPKSPHTLQMEQQERELGSILDGIRATPRVNLRPASASSVIEAPTRRNPPRDREAERVAKMAKKFEATLRQKLMERIPSERGEGAAQALLIKTFKVIDEDEDGEVDLLTFYRVCARLGVICSVPPSPQMAVLIDAFFNKWADADGLLAYGPFARQLLKTPKTVADILDPPPGGHWQYNTRVTNVLNRRCLEPGQMLEPEVGPGQHECDATGEVRRRPTHDEWRRIELGTMPVEPINTIDGAPLRGRLAGGRDGRRAFHAAARAARQAMSDGRAEHDRQALAARKAYQDAFLAQVDDSARAHRDGTASRSAPWPA
jgi:hypothetical protein